MLWPGVAIIIRMCNLRGVVRHSPRLAKLAHNATTHKATQVLHVRLSAKKRLIFSAVKSLQAARSRICCDRTSVCLPRYSGQTPQFLFCLDRFLVVEGLCDLLHPDSTGGWSHCVDRFVGRIQKKDFCSGLLQITRLQKQPIRHGVGTFERTY